LLALAQSFEVGNDISREIISHLLDLFKVVRQQKTLFCNYCSIDQIPALFRRCTTSVKKSTNNDMSPTTSPNRWGHTFTPSVTDSAKDRHHPCGKAQ
jgi:hypothetical protein